MCVGVCMYFAFSNIATLLQNCVLLSKSTAATRRKTHLRRCRNTLEPTAIFRRSYMYIQKVNIKWCRYRPGVAQRVGRGIALFFHDRGTRRWWVVSSTLRPHFTPGKNWYPLYRRLDGPQGRSGRAEILVPTGIQSRTAQQVVSRFTDWATGPIYIYIYIVGLKVRLK